MSEKNVLFLCPQFYGYYKDIAQAAKKLSLNLIWFDDAPRLNSFQYFLKRLSKNYYKKKINKYIDEIIKEIKCVKIDCILLINGLSLNGDLISKIKKALGNPKIIYYARDSTKVFPVIKEISNISSKTYSFDWEDCQKYGFTFLPLFYTEESKMESLPTNYDYCCFMNFYPNKASSFLNVKNALPNNLIGFEHLKLKSKIFYFYFKIFYHNDFKYFSLKNFKFYDLDREAINQLILESKVIIDCPLEGQNGLTMRTFEVLSKFKKLITTNENIKYYPFYSPNNIFIVKTQAENIPLEFFNTPFDKKFSLSNEYSVENFVKIIFKEI